MSTLLAPDRPAWRRSLRLVLRLEPPVARSGVLILLLVAAFLSPNIALPAGLPAVRLEQVLLFLLLPSVAAYHLAHPEAREVGRIDVAFLILLAAIGVSVVVAPILVPQVGRSDRDVFQLLRPIEYWILYRVARTAETDEVAGRRLILLLAAFGAIGGALAFLQVVGGRGFNETVTAIWTGVGHNLDGLILSGRAVGTVGNANLFGLLQGWFALVAIVGVLLRVPVARGRPWILLPALGLSIVGMVASQSRSATLSITVAALIGIAAVVILQRPWSRQSRRQLAAATVGILAAVLIGTSVAVAAAALPGRVSSTAPPDSGSSSGSSIGSRFDISTLGTDASLIERFAILRYAFVPRNADAERVLTCDGPAAGTVRTGHEPAGSPEAQDSGSASPGTLPGATTQASVKAADIARSIERLYCESGRWPVSLSGTGIVADPGVVVRFDGSGYEVSAPPASPADGPAYTLTNHPDLILDPSFEEPTSGAWNVSPGGSVRSVPGGLFGNAAGQVSFPAEGFLDQYVVYTFAPATDYAVSLWARSTDGASQDVTLALDAWLIGGDRIPGIAKVSGELPADGRWVQLSGTFRTPPSGRIWVMRTLVMASDRSAPLSILIDGAELHQGVVPASFAYLRDADPGSLPSALPSFWQSPLIGVGPMSNVEFGAIDNEYALMLLRFGVLGLIAYVVLFVVAAATGISTWRRRRPGSPAALGLALALALLATAAYSLAAGSYYSYQVMAIFWLWVGWVGAAGTAGTASRRAEEPAAASGRPT